VVERTLHVYAYVEAPFDDVSHLLASDAVGLLQQATDESAEQASTLSRKLRVAVGGFDIGSDVSIEVGDFEPRAVTRSVVPLRWRSEKGRLLFPRLTAELEVAAIVFDPPLTQLTVIGSYEPSSGLLGAGADKLLLHRLAEATLHRFTHEVADELRRRLEKDQSTLVDDAAVDDAAVDDVPSTDEDRSAGEDRSADEIATSGAEPADAGEDADRA
jgi:hypothetical protein